MLPALSPSPATVTTVLLQHGSHHLLLFTIPDRPMKFHIPLLARKTLHDLARSRPLAPLLGTLHPPKPALGHLRASDVAFPPPGTPAPLPSSKIPLLQLGHRLSGAAPTPTLGWVRVFCIPSYSWLSATPVSSHNSRPAVRLHYCSEGGTRSLVNSGHSVNTG